MKYCTIIKHDFVENSPKGYYFVDNETLEEITELIIADQAKARKDKIKSFKRWFYVFNILACVFLMPGILAENGVITMIGMAFFWAACFLFLKILSVPKSRTA